MLSRAWLISGLLLGLMVTVASADEWVAVKLRGQVVQLVDGHWLPLQRGDVVSDDRVVRTLKNGRVEFHRDAEVITLGPQTQIQIVEKTGQRFTTVIEQFGEVAIEAEVQNVQHFAVQTPFMAAVVKGTMFVVRSGKDYSNVEVLRGHVAVESEVTHSTTLVSAGQSATASNKAELRVQGEGDLPPIIAANGKVISEDGQPVVSAADAAALAKQLKEAAKHATGDEKKALEKAAKEAEKEADKAEKESEKAAKEEAKDAEKEEKAADKGDKDSGKKGDK